MLKAEQACSLHGIAFGLMHLYLCKSIQVYCLPHHHMLLLAHLAAQLAD